MTEETAAIPAGGEALPDFSHSPAGDGALSAREAARSLADARYKRDAEQSRQAEQPQAPPAQELSQEDNAAPPEEATGETQESDPAVEELPPIEPPRSWSKEKRESWAKLDRDLQEYLAEHDREASATVRRAQNEAAEKLKGVTTKEQQLDQARQQYESALPILLQNLHASYDSKFSDIKTIQDVMKLSEEDPFRYAQWDAQQKQIAAVQQEIVAAQQRQAQERVQKLDEFKLAESKALLDAIPDLRDTGKLTQAQNAAISVLKDIGFKDDELAALGRGEKEVSVHDHRFQRILHEAAQYRDAKEKAKAVKAVPKPPAQRPGSPRPAGSDKADQIQALEKQLATATGLAAIRLGAELTKLKRAG